MCPKCNTQIESDYNFCSKCGKDLRDMQIACSKCDTNIHVWLSPRGTKFCPRCGNPMIQPFHSRV